MTDFLTTILKEQNIRSAGKTELVWLSKNRGFVLKNMVQGKLTQEEKQSLENAIQNHPQRGTSSRNKYRITFRPHKMIDGYEVIRLTKTKDNS